MLQSLVAACVAVGAGIFAFVAGKALGGAWIGASAAGIAIAALVGWWVWRRTSMRLDVAGIPRALQIVAAVSAPIALIQLVRIAIFIVEPAQVGCSFVPTSAWEVRHSCATAYFVAAQASASTANVYDNSLYSLPDDAPDQPRKPRMLGAFQVDVYEYPPQFLLLSRAMGSVAPDFTRFRMLWFALSGGTLLLALWVVARFLEPTAATRALLLSPLVWISLPTVSVLQKGNAQVVAITAAMLAMVLFERRRWALGGVLLAFVTVSKLFPGLLLLYLIVRRQWRAVAWTSALALAFSLATLWVLGRESYIAFLDHLPGLMSGEAFPAFRRPSAAAANYSIPGIIFKLHLFGIPGMSFPAAKIVGWMYTLVAVAVTVFAASRWVREGSKPLVWLAILCVATLRSPFLPAGYAAVPAVWLVTLLGATRLAAGTKLATILLLWAVLSVYWPQDWPIDPRLLASLMTVPQIVFVMVVVRALRGTREASSRTSSLPAVAAA